MTTKTSSQPNMEQPDQDKVRRALAGAAKAYNWQKVLKILNEHPDLVNSTRPGGKSLYTPLHQAADGGAPVEIVQQLLDLGASTTAQNAKGERPVDVAKRKGHQDLAQRLEPPSEEISLLHFPSEITDALSTCALRFDGYAFVAALQREGGDAAQIDLPQLADAVSRDLRLHDNLNYNFAAFFALQRYLHKWGGEYLTKYADEHIAYDFLFLHLYQHEPPAPFRMEEYCQAWQKEFAAEVESIAAYVRRSFRRVGSGKKIAL